MMGGRALCSNPAGGHAASPSFGGAKLTRSLRPLIRKGPLGSCFGCFGPLALALPLAAAAAGGAFPAAAMALAATTSLSATSGELISTKAEP